MGTGCETLGSMVIDPTSGSLFVTENDGATGTNRVLRAAGHAAQATVLVEGSPWNWITNLEFQPGDGVAAFRPYQPARGGRLLYNTSDYVTLFERNELAPLRPSAWVSGPGTTGAGNVDLSVIGGPPSGMAWAYHCPSSLFDPAELPIFLASQQVNLFVGLDPWTTELHQFPILLDGAGSGSITFFNDGSLTGQLAIQPLVFDAQGQAVALAWAAFL